MNKHDEYKTVGYCYFTNFILQGSLTLRKRGERKREREVKINKSLSFGQWAVFVGGGRRRWLSLEKKKKKKKRRRRKKWILPYVNSYGTVSV